MTPVAHLALFAAAACLIAPACSASEVEAANVSVSAPASAASHGLFSSWFTTKSTKVDAPVVEATGESDVIDTNAAPTGSRASDLVVNALGLLGINYRFGGNSPASGFDCSGMVRYVFQNAMGLSLPRRAEEISRVGAKVSLGDLKPGDLVFYKTLRKTFSHVGIYLGNNRFIHAPSSGGAVRVEDMTQGYWAARFNGARRVDS